MKKRNETKKPTIKNSAELFLYKSKIDLSSAKVDFLSLLMS